MNSKADIENEIKSLSKTIMHAYNNATKKQTVTENKLPIPENIKNIIKTKNRLRRQNQRVNNPIIKREINYLTNTINTLINSLKSDKWENTLRKINTKNPKNLWKISKA